MKIFQLKVYLDLVLEQQLKLEKIFLNLEIGQSAENSNPDRFFDASNLIVANTAFIADVAYGRMRDAYPSYNPPAGQMDKIVRMILLMYLNLLHITSDTVEMISQ